MATIAVESINGQTGYVIHAGGESCLLAWTMTEAILLCIGAGLEVANG